jgi:hypothetical protein
MRLTSIALLAASLLFSTGAWGQDYAIKMQRPLKVGDKHRVEGTGAIKQATTVTSEGKVLKADGFDVTAAYEGEETTMEVGDKGRPTKTSIKVGKLTVTEGGKTTDALPKDTVVIASKPGKATVYEVGGKPVDPQAAKLLALFVSVGDTGSTDDDILGTKERKKAGDSWPADGKRAAEEMQGELQGGRVENLTGTAKLESVEKRAGGEVMKISASLIGKCAPPLPPQLTVEDGKIEMRAGGEFPVNPDGQRLTDIARISLTFTASGDSQQGKITVKGEMTQSHDLKITPVK